VLYVSRRSPSLFITTREFGKRGTESEVYSRSLTSQIGYYIKVDCVRKKVEDYQERTVGKVGGEGSSAGLSEGWEISVNVQIHA